MLTPAVGGDDVGELARLQSLGALEHQMLEKVREPRFAGLLVGGADAVPHGVVHDRRAAVHYHHDLQAVVEVKRSEEHTSELQSLMRISYAVFCLKKKKNIKKQ